MKKILILLILSNTSIVLANTYYSIVKGDNYKVVPTPDEIIEGEWSNVGDKFDCAKLEDKDLYYYGFEFTQREECYQEQKRVVSYLNKKELIKEDIEYQVATTTDSYLENGTHLEESCKFILDNNYSQGSGIYQIINNGYNLDVYCEMDQNDGGWTFVMSEGTEYSRTHSFWDGVDPNDGLSTIYKDYSISTSISSNLIENLKFNDILIMDDDTPRLYTSDFYSTFKNKKLNQSKINGLTWNFSTPTSGYTKARFLLADVYGANSYDDYATRGLGVSGEATSRGSHYGTYHRRFSGLVNCGYPSDTSSIGGGCHYNNNYTSNASLGNSQHRHIIGDRKISLFFR